MDIHKPKSWHSAREFLKEYAIVVVGVLTALGAEQTVEAFHWRHKVAEAEQAMRLELLDDDLPQAFTRLAVSACVDGDLNAVDDALDAGRPRPEVAALAHRVRLPIRTWDMEAWRAALAGDVASHMSSERMIGWSDPYRVIPAMDQVNRRETELLGDLQAGGRRPGDLTDAERERISVAVEQLRNTRRAMSVWSQVLMATAAERGLIMTATRKAEILAQLRGAYGVCVKAPPRESEFDLGSTTGALDSTDGRMPAPRKEAQ
ncbi:MAG TPA: hypothetical protein VGC92_10455 [Phenylobacterium sp.]